MGWVTIVGRRLVDLSCIFCLFRTIIEEDFLFGEENMNTVEESFHYRQKECSSSNKLVLWWKKTKIWCRQKLFKKTEIPYLEMFVTSHCNLRCKNCSNRIPYLEKKEHFCFEKIKVGIDTLLNKIDILYRLKIHGGEVLLHPQIGQIITYLNEKNKIKSIRLATNGTIIPTDTILKILAKSKVVVQISDYPHAKEKREILINKMKEHGVKYVFLQGQQWVDMGDLKRRTHSRFTMCTMKRCTSLLDGKIYVCSRAAILSRQEILSDSGIDIYAKKKVFQKKLKLFYSETDNRACWFCDGDSQYALPVPAGEQIRESNL